MCPPDRSTHIRFTGKAHRVTAHPAPATRHKPTAAEYRYMRGTEEFQGLRKTFRSFTFPLTIAGLVWYIAYVLFATFAPDLMGTPVFGDVNLGIILGLLQFVTTFAITWWYISFANKKLEPVQASIREEMETGQIAQKLKEGK